MKKLEYDINMLMDYQTKRADKKKRTKRIKKR